MKYDKSRVTIVIPAKNEGEGIARIIRSVKPYSNNIIVVDGHSSDNSKDVAKHEKADFLLDHGKGRGDGVRIGIHVTKTPYIVLFDADGSHDVKDIPKIVRLLATDQADMVICSRKTGGSFDASLSLSGMIRSFGSDLLGWLVNKRFGTNFTDIIYSFRGVKKRVAEKLELKSDGFGIEQEMVISCLKKGFRIKEIPSRERARAWGRTKLQTISGLSLLVELIKSLYFQ